MQTSSQTSSNAASQNWLADLSSGLIVFFVATPLCLGIALASNAPLSAGLISGIIGALVISLLSGSRLGISSPAAGLIVIVLEALASLGTWEIFLSAVVIAGFLQLVFGFLKFGALRYFFSAAVIRGLLAGIGLIVVIKQVPYLLGSSLENVLQMQQWNMSLVLISVLAFLVYFLSSWLHQKVQSAYLRFLQPPLIVVLICSVAAMVLSSMMPGFDLELSDFVVIPSVSGADGWRAFFAFPDFSMMGDWDVWKFALLIAAVGGLESLLCVEAVDQLDPKGQQTPTNRELLAQGAGNVLCGFLGGLPVVQEIVRSNTNLQSGGQTKKSNMFHGVFLILTVLFFGKLLNAVPLASLAAILVVIGIRLVNIPKVIEFYRTSKPSFVIFVLTTLGIVFVNLLFGVFAGMVLSFAWVLYKKHRADISLEQGVLVLRKHVRFYHRYYISKYIKKSGAPEIDVSNTVSVDAEAMAYLTKLPSKVKVHGSLQSEVL